MFHIAQLFISTRFEVRILMYRLCRGGSEKYEVGSYFVLRNSYSRSDTSKFVTPNSYLLRLAKVELKYFLQDNK